MSMDRRKLQRNISWIVLGLWGLFGLIALRYAWLQIIEGSRMADRVRNQTGEERVLQSPRGAIIDRNGRELAISVMTKSLFVDPASVQDANDVAARLSPLISVPEEEIREDIAQGGGFVWVKRRLEQTEVSAVKKLIKDEGWNCLGFRDEAKRYYPNDLLAANIIGFVGTGAVASPTTALRCAASAPRRSSARRRVRSIATGEKSLAVTCQPRSAS